MEQPLVLSALADDLSLSQINLAGTHDSATAFCALRKIARCQNTTIEEQLRLGVRLLDIRLYLRRGRFFLVHSHADCFTDGTHKVRLRFDDVFAACVSFLEQHPRETLVVSIKSDRGRESTAFFRAFYETYIRPNMSRWYLGNRVPTLGVCRGKLVLLRRCPRASDFESRETCGLDFSDWEDQRSHKRTEPVHMRMSEKLCAEVQDRYHLPPDIKWARCAKPFLDICAPTASRICLHFLSTCGGHGIPAQNAGAVNAQFAAYPLHDNRAQGWFFLDFIDRTLCDKIMRSNLQIYAASKLSREE